MRILSEGERIARKAHKCDWCRTAIVPGERYYRYFVAAGYDSGEVKLHKECYEASFGLPWEDGDMMPDMAMKRGECVEASYLGVDLAVPGSEKTVMSE